MGALGAPDAEDVMELPVSLELRFVSLRMCELVSVGVSVLVSFFRSRTSQNNFDLGSNTPML